MWYGLRDVESISVVNSSIGVAMLVAAAAVAVITATGRHKLYTLHSTSHCLAVKF